MSASLASAKPSPKNVRDIALYRSRQGQAIFNRLKKAAQLAGSQKARKTAEKIRACVDHENVWTAEDLHSIETGDLYEGCGTLFSCGSRFCPSCSAALRRRARKRLREILDFAGPGRGEVPSYWHTLRWRFCTLTGPLDSLPLIEKMAIYQEAWELLRKRKFWQDLLIEVGAKGGEFVVKVEGYHVHFHILIFSKWVIRDRLAAEWSACLRKAYLATGRKLVVNTPSGLCVVDVRAVKPRLKGIMSTETTVSLEFAIREVLKYVTKSNSWLDVPEVDLVKMAEINRWPRLFEILGACKRVPQKPRATSLDTSGLSDGKVTGKTPSAYRKNLENLPFEDWRKHFLKSVEIMQDFRRKFLIEKFPYATFCDLAGQSWGARSKISQRQSGGR